MKFQVQRYGLSASRRIRSKRPLLGVSIVLGSRRFLVCERIAMRFVNGLTVLCAVKRALSPAESSSFSCSLGRLSPLTPPTTYRSTARRLVTSLMKRRTRYWWGGWCHRWQCNSTRGVMRSPSPPAYRLTRRTRLLTGVLTGITSTSSPRTSTRWSSANSGTTAGRRSATPSPRTTAPKRRATTSRTSPRARSLPIGPSLGRGLSISVMD